MEAQNIEFAVKAAVALRAAGNFDGFTTVWDVLARFVGQEVASDAIEEAIRVQQAAEVEASRLREIEYWRTIDARKAARAAKREAMYSK